MEKNSAKTLICVCGPTAVGKTSMAISLAQHFNSEIISFDSRQFYCEMSIGTAVPSAHELASAPHHFIHDRSLSQALNAGSYESEALIKLEELFKIHQFVIAVGGTGLYLKALLQGMDELPPIPPEIRQEINLAYREKGLGFLQEKVSHADPAYYAKMDQQNPQRLIRALELLSFSGKKMADLQVGKPKSRAFKALQIGLDMDREILYDRINRRVDSMMAEGLLDEVKSLVGFRKENALQTVGYKEIFNYLDGDISLSKAIEEIKKNSRRYAKRQLTWFRRDTNIKWFAAGSDKDILAYINSQIDA